MTARRLVTLIPFMALWLAACGGGGGDTPVADSATSPGSTVAPAASGGDCGLANFQAELLQRINAVRAAGANCGTDPKTGHVYGVFAPTGPLAWNDKLASAALGHSTDMATRNYFDHTTPDGVSFSQRITDAGYAWSTAAENIAAGYATVQKVMDGWIASPGHCANLMNPALRDVGVACVPGSATSTYPNDWTMDLAAPR